MANRNVNAAELELWPVKMFPQDIPDYELPSERNFRAQLLNVDDKKGLFYLKFFRNNLQRVRFSEFVSEMAQFYNIILDSNCFLRVQALLTEIVVNQIVIMHIGYDTYIRGFVERVDDTIVYIRDGDTGAIVAGHRSCVYNIHEEHLFFSFQSVPCTMMGLEFFMNSDAAYRVFRNLGMTCRSVTGVVEHVIDERNQTANGVFCVTLNTAPYDGVCPCLNLNSHFLSRITSVCVPSMNEGALKEGYISFVESTGELWIRFAEDNSLHVLVRNLERLMEVRFPNVDDRNKASLCPSCLANEIELDTDFMVFVMIIVGDERKYYRAKVSTIYFTSVVVQLIDYGHVLVVHCLQIFPIPQEMNVLRIIPGLAFQAKLSQVSHFRPEVQRMITVGSDFLRIFYGVVEDGEVKVKIYSDFNENEPHLGGFPDLTSFILEYYKLSDIGAIGPIGPIQPIRRLRRIGPVPIPMANPRGEEEDGRLVQNPNLFAMWYNNRNDEMDEEQYVMNFQMITIRIMARILWPVPLDVMANPLLDLAVNPNIVTGNKWKFLFSSMNSLAWILLEDHVNRDFYTEMESSIIVFYNRFHSLFRGSVTSENLVSNKGLYVARVGNNWHRILTVSDNPAPTALQVPPGHVQVILIDVGPKLIVPIYSLYPMHLTLQQAPMKCYIGYLTGVTRFDDVKRRMRYLSRSGLLGTAVTVEVQHVGMNRFGGFQLFVNLTDPPESTYFDNRLLKNNIIVNYFGCSNNAPR